MQTARRKTPCQKHPHDNTPITLEKAPETRKNIAPTELTPSPPDKAHSILTEPAQHIQGTSQNAGPTSNPSHDPRSS